jgi:hypothetical protein
MAKSGIEVNESLRRALIEVQEKKLAWVKIQIDEGATEFKKISEGASKGSEDADWAVIKGQLDEKEPSYVFFQAPRLDGKWIVIFHCPESSRVKAKMLYASSINAVKAGFGLEKLTKPDTFRISKPSECTAKDYIAHSKEVDEEDILTDEERLSHNAAQDSAMSTGGSRVSAVMGVPVKIKDEASDALVQVRDGGVNTVILRLNPETEVLEAANSGNFALEEVAKQMTKTDPRYILHNFKHEREDKQVDAIVFFYYCPDGAKPRLKMFYSSCKAMIIKICENLSIEVKKSLESSEPTEINGHLVLDELYPKKTVKKTFSKPKGRGKGARRLAGGVKFQGGASEASSPEVTSPSSGEPEPDEESL